MIFRFLLISLLLVPVKVSADNDPSGKAPIRFTTRLGIAYVPISTIKFTNRDETYDIYDNLAYRLSIEYHPSSLFSLGPSFEYLGRRIDPYAFFEEDIRMYSFYLDFRINHGLTDSGASYLIFGAGTGASSLAEAEGESGSGFGLYGLVGLDIALWESIGLEFIYRYQTSRITIKERDYRFDGSAIQTGLSYRFRF